MALTSGGPVPDDALTERAMLIRLLEAVAADPCPDEALAGYLTGEVLPALRALPEPPAEPLTVDGSTAAVARLPPPFGGGRDVPAAALYRFLGWRTELTLADGRRLEGTLVFDDRAVPAGADMLTALRDYIMVRSVVHRVQIRAAAVEHP